MSDHPKEKISARLDPEVARVVEQVAAAERRPVNNLIRNVITDWARGVATEPGARLVASLALAAVLMALAAAAGA